MLDDRYDFLGDWNLSLYLKRLRGYIFFEYIQEKIVFKFIRFILFISFKKRKLVGEREKERERERERENFTLLR